MFAAARRYVQIECVCVSLFCYFYILKTILFSVHHLSFCVCFIVAAATAATAAVDVVEHSYFDLKIVELSLSVVASKSCLLSSFTLDCGSNEFDFYLVYDFLLARSLLSKAHNHQTNYYILWLCQVNIRFTMPQNVYTD